VHATTVEISQARSAPRARSLMAVILIDVAALIAVIALTALGTWQMHRRTWKLDLIARVETRVHAAPTEPPSRKRWGEITAAGDEYRRVRAEGEFLFDKTTLVQAVTDLGGGFWAMTPLRLADGTVVLVNRGFVPADRRDPALWSLTPGMTIVTGLLRISEPGGGFLRANDPAGDRWFSRDVQAIAAARGLTDVAPYYIDAEKTPGETGYPTAGLTVIAFHNNHLLYALTWYALALIVAAFAIVVTADGFRSRAGGRAAALSQR
jgi:surfeit locus 1 family protein